MRKPRHRVRIRFLLTAIVLWFGLSTLSSFGQTIRFDSIKAECISLFPEFIHWEGKAPNEEITIGVLGSQNLSQALSKIASDPKTRRPLRIIPVDPDQELRRMDILYIGEGQRKHWEKIMRKCKSRQILVIGSDKGFLEAGGCIQFVRQQVNVKFAINIKSAENYNVRLSSKIVELALYTIQ